MVKSKNIIAGLGVVAGLGMALLPLGAFAADSNAVDHTIRGVVGDTISITSVATNKAKEIKIGEQGGEDVKQTISEVALVPGELNATLKHTVTVHTNTRSGFRLQMMGKEGNTYLGYITEWDEYGEGQKAKTIVDSIKIASITEDTALAGASESGWGYKAKRTTSGSSDTDADKFKAIPAAATTIATSPVARSAEETGAYDDTFEVTYGIKPAIEQLAGSYEGTVVYTAVTSL